MSESSNEVKKTNGDVYVTRIIFPKNCIVAIQAVSALLDENITEFVNNAIYERVEAAFSKIAAVGVRDAFKLPQIGLVSEHSHIDGICDDGICDLCDKFIQGECLGDAGSVEPMPL